MSAHYVAVHRALAECSCGWAADGRTVRGARAAAAEHESEVMGTLLTARTPSIHPVAVPAHKPTRSERQSAMDHAGRPDRIRRLIADLHADIDYHQGKEDT